MHAFGEFLVLAVLASLPVGFVYFDIAVIGHAVGETSVTEIAQEILLLTIVLIFWYGAWRYPNSRSVCVLVAGFFSCALIRELDSVFDAIRHGAWFWVALTVALSTVAYVVVNWRTTVVRAMSEFVGTRPYVHIMTGLIILLVFSRTFGSGNLLWEEVLVKAYTMKFKSAMQEGLELFGYLFITYGSVALCFKRFGS